MGETTERNLQQIGFVSFFYIFGKNQKLKVTQSFEFRVCELFIISLLFIATTNCNMYPTLVGKMK